jgi:hypothetical protein
MSITISSTPEYLSKHIPLIQESLGINLKEQMTLISVLQTMLGHNVKITLEVSNTSGIGSNFAINIDATDYACW